MQVRLTESEYKVLTLFRENASIYSAIRNSNYTKSTLLNYFYRLRSKEVIAGSFSSYSFPAVDIEVRNINRKTTLLEKAKEGKKKALNALKEPKEIDCGFHYVNGKRVEHPVKLLPLKFTDKGILNVYPEFPKAS